MKKYLLEIVVFVSGAILMIFELVGSRIFSPYLGSSLVVWTSIIGVIMGSLSLGYWLGGVAVDKRAEYRVLSGIILFASFFVLLATVFCNYIISFVSLGGFDLRFNALVSAILIFAPASIFFGMVSPYAIKLKLDDLEGSGAKIGSMYAISTLGSIFGTFAGGFYLVPKFGTVHILYILVLSLLILSFYILAARSEKIEKNIFICVCFIFTVLFSSQAVFSKGLDFVADIDTLYNRAIVCDGEIIDSKRPVRIFTFDPGGAQSAIYLDNNDDLVVDYLKYYRLAPHFKNNIKNALMIGGGVFTYPVDFIKRNPKANIDVVEIDSGLLDIAKDYFDFKDDDRINIIHEGGRTFLNRNSEKYDVVFMDAFNAEHSIPFQLTTKEAVRSIYNALGDDGVVLVNTISAIDGDRGRFLRAEIATYKELFPQVFVFPVKNNKEADEVQNIMLLALKSEQVPSFSSDDSELAEYLAKVWKKDINLDLPVLTDDYAPVEYYTLSKKGRN